MATWKKILVFPTASATVDNSFVTVNIDDSQEVVSINDLPAIDTTGYDSIASAIGENADNYMFVVHDIANADHKKLSASELYGSIATNLLNEVQTGGLISADTNIQGIGVGGAADLNGDGDVSTADLLQFLTAFGQVVAINPISVSVVNCASTSITATGVGTSTYDTLDLDNFTVVLHSDVSVTTSPANNYFDIDQDGIVFSDFASEIDLKVASMNVGVVGSFEGQIFRMRARVRQYNGTGTLLGTSAYNAFPLMMISNPGGVTDFDFNDITIFTAGSLNQYTEKLRVDFEIQEFTTNFGANGTPLSANIVAAEVLFDRNA